MTHSAALKLFTLAAVVVGLGTGISHARCTNPGGHWMGPDQQELTIIGSNWYHPTYGAATITTQEGTANYTVQYHSEAATICKYRIRSGANYELHIVAAAHPQSAEACPTGTFVPVCE